MNVENSRLFAIANDSLYSPELSFLHAAVNDTIRQRYFTPPQPHQKPLVRYDRAGEIMRGIV